MQKTHDYKSTVNGQYLQRHQKILHINTRLVMIINLQLQKNNKMCISSRHLKHSDNDIHLTTTQT
jgi:hypothetical protein